MTEWIIGIGGSLLDDVITYKVVGDVEEVKAHLLSLVNKAKVRNYWDWDFGTETIEEIRWKEGRLYAFACFESGHEDFTATPLFAMETIKLSM